jgi:AcrR family transcriptional regulator
MLYHLFVHSTNKNSSTLYDVASEFPAKRPIRPRPGRGPAVDSGEAIRQFVADVVAEKINTKINTKVTRKAEKVAAHAQHHLESLDRLAAHLDALDVWTRVDPGSRKPRFSRDDIAAAAIHIADTEGLEAVSMRRIAAELGSGTMTLYHYVRTKDELFTLVSDAVMGEVALPADHVLPADWREALTLVADRSRAALLRHPWMLDIHDDPPIGPNSVRHFDQSYAAVASLPISLAERFELILAVDEYVFGYCMHERNNDHGDPDSFDREVLSYVADLIATGDYPQLSAIAEAEGLESAWDHMESASRDPSRFDRNLARLLDGFEREFYQR